MTDDEIRESLGLLQSHNLALTALVVHLLVLLRRKGHFSREEQNEAFDNAVLKIEEIQAKAEESEKWIFEMARDRIENLLPKAQKPGNQPTG